MKSVKTALLAGAAFVALASPVFAQSNAGTDSAPKTHHRHVAATTDSGRLERLEHLVEQQEQQIQDLKSQLGSGQANAQVSATQFQTLQTQVTETQAAVKTATANQGAVKFNHAHLTISSPDGRYTFSPIVDVQGDWASYSKGQPLPNGITTGKNDLKSSGENFRRASIGFQGTFAGDFGYKFLYDFGGANGNETYQGYPGPNSGVYVQSCTVKTSPCPVADQTTTLLNNAYNTSTGAGTGPHIRYAWVSYKGILAPFTFQIGSMPTPANLNDMTSADDLLFNERPSPSQLSRGLDGDDGRESVGFIGNGDIWQASLYLTGDTFGKAALLAPQTTYGGGQEAVVGRVALAPWYDPATNFNVHLGGNFGYVIHPQEATSVTASGVSGVTTYGITFSDRPELRVDNVTFLNTGAINSKSAYSAGVEGAFSYGPFLIQGENFWYGIDRNNPGTGISNPSFAGWYVEGSWVLTGDVHKYNMATASYTRPSPATPFDPSNGYWGAWELAGRYSDTNLDYDATSTFKNATTGVSEAVLGGIQKIWSAGINFYPNDTLKFMFDYQNVTLKDIGAVNQNGSYNTLSVRTQVTF
jgi:phosphate-selective porin OprO/OprP